MHAKHRFQQSVCRPHNIEISSVCSTESQYPASVWAQGATNKCKYSTYASSRDSLSLARFRLRTLHGVARMNSKNKATLKLECCNGRLPGRQFYEVCR